MPLIPGTRLGPYEVLAPLGAGGMGEVYRARDTRLDREVAIKVLPAALAHDAERLVRFERESKVVASLNHPHIAQIYGVEENGDTHALVMELVAGATLAVPQPLDTALDYARQIAEALEAAHEKGITHRDLKPGNIMVTPEGVVKVLDFGLATAPSREGASDPTNSPTFTMAATQAGMIMGTASYMSPEQAAGKAVDRRSDIWSFGAVLWEMLTGAKLFEGETISHTLADVLRAPIEFGKLPESTPAPIAELVKRCLDRNLKTRLQAIGEARIAIEKYRQDPTGGVMPTPPPDVRLTKRSLAPWIVAAAFALAAAGLGIVAYRHSQEPPPRVWKTSILPPDKTGFVPNSVPAISPDGRKLAFAATQDGKTQLWIRDLDSLTARGVSGSDGAINPFWSPDSQSIAFHADGKIKRIDLSGGAVMTVCATEGNFHGASWSPRGLILTPISPTGPLYRVPASGGTPAGVTALDEAAGEISHRLPWFLPDGRHFLFTIRHREQGAKSAVYVGDLDSKERKLVLNGEAHAVYAAGFLLYTIGGIVEGPLMAQPFDAAALRTTGEPFPIAESVDLSTAVWASHQFSASRDGALVYSSAGSSNTTQLTWFDRAGRVLGTVGAADAGVYTAAISPDGRTVATTRLLSGTRDVWLHDLQRGVASRFTFNPANSAAVSPVWSADGAFVLYGRFESSRSMGIRKKAASGASVEEPVSQAWGAPARNLGLLTASKDGRYLAGRTNPGGTTGSDIWMMPLRPPGETPRPYLQTNANEGTPSLSPSGDWLAYSSDETRRFEVYVQSFPEPGRKYQVSVNGGTRPVWSRDAKELFFIALDRQMMAAPIRMNGGRLEIGTPKALFDSRIAANNQNITFDVAADGRFLIPAHDQELNAPWNLVVNWQAGLKK